ncbi:hypothetical protein AN958_05342 [Leucoagaricus sp. SymC.cos]|nr:hypothetical protein AN958_05342 [Leucoagaricus sp. SymC.cos]
MLTTGAPIPETAAATTTPGKPQYEAPASSTPPAIAPAASSSLGSVFRLQEFRRNDSTFTPYFHTHIPPVGQGQDSPYRAFNQLGVHNQHQQGSRLGGFSSSISFYMLSRADIFKGFYESYPQQIGFGNRNAPGHDDIKGLPGNQQPPASSLPPSTTQTSQHSSQSNQSQSAGGQGPQQFPPPLVPYYYNPYPQNQYYEGPYSSGYVPQPYTVKFFMFQHGLPGANSAPAGYNDYQQPSHVLGLRQVVVGLSGGS